MDVENLDMEWKESWADKYLKTIAAFYNTKGGRMIIGRKDNDEYIGVQDIKGTTKSVSDSIRNKLHIISETSVESIEGWGQGISKVMAACKENGNPEPEFSYMSSGFLVILRPKGIQIFQGFC